MAKKRLDVDIKGKETVSKAAKKAGSALDTLKKGAVGGAKTAGSAMAGFAGAVGIAAAAIYGAVRLVQDLTQAYKIQATAEAKLEAALKATKNAVGITSSEMKEFAKEMSRLTGIADEAVIGAEALMTTFTQVGKDVFPEAIKSAADMSVMFGQDLQQSVIQLGTALNDPIAGVGRLKRIGISFTKTQRDMIKNFTDQGDIMSAQTVILDELNAEFGGVAELMGGKALAASEHLKNSIGDFKELGGEVITNFTAPFKRAMATMISDFVTARQEIRNLKSAIEGDEGADVLSAYDAQKKKIADLRVEMAALEDIAELRVAATWQEVNLAKTLLAEKRAQENSEKMILNGLRESARVQEEHLDIVIKNDEYWNKLAKTYKDKVFVELAKIAKMEKDLGVAYDDNAEKAKFLKDTILEMYEDGFESGGATFEWLKTLLEQITDIKEETEEATDAVKDYWKEWTSDPRLVPGYGGYGINPNDDSGTDEDGGLVGGELGTIIETIKEGGSMIMTIIGIVVTALSNIEEFATVLNFVTEILGILGETVIQPILKMLTPFLNVARNIIDVIGNLLYPILNALVPAFEALAQMLVYAVVPIFSILSPFIALLLPVLDLVRGLLVGVAIAITVLLSPIEFLADLFMWFGEHIIAAGKNIAIFLYNMTHPLKPKSYVKGPGGEFSSDAFTGLNDKIDELLELGTSQFLDGTFDEFDLSGGTDDLFDDTSTTVSGGTTTIQRAPDIYISNNYYAPIVGVEGSVEHGRIIAASIEEFYGVGGRIEIIENEVL